MMQAIRHGGALDRAIAEHGGRREDWLDLSTGINPLAYPTDDLAPDVWRALPDEGLLDACLDAARRYFGVPDEAGIVAAPGTQAIIQWLPVLFGHLDRVTIVQPTYGEYQRVFAMTGVRVATPAELPRDAGDTDLLVAGQPNNPDGRIWPAGQLMPFAEGRKMAVIDEAFADVAPEASLVGRTGEGGPLVLRSFGKFFGLAGLRLGFAIGDADVIAALASMIGPWAVSGPALAIGARAMRDEAWIGETRARLASDRGRLETLLRRHGMEIVGGTDLFVTAKIPGAHALHEALASRHVLTRTFDHDASWIRFGLPGDDLARDRLDSALGAIDPTVQKTGKC